MSKRITLLVLAFLIAGTVAAVAQSLDSNPYRPGIDPDPDMYMGDWHNSMPAKTHGSLIERDILTKGDPMKPTRPGGAMKFANRYTHATLMNMESTQPTTLDGEQEILYIHEGTGTITGNGKTFDLKKDTAVLIPANLEFVMKNTGDTPMEMFLVNEPIPMGFRPNADILVRYEPQIPIDSTDGHWVHIVRYLFTTEDGLGTLERVLTVALDPMTIGQPHSHAEGVEEVWTGMYGESVAWIGKQIRMQPPGVGYMIPPDGKTPHSNINEGPEQIKMFYWARYGDHEVRP